VLKLWVWVVKNSRVDSGCFLLLDALFRHRLLTVDRVLATRARPLGIYQIMHLHPLEVKTLNNKTTVMNTQDSLKLL